MAIDIPAQANHHARKKREAQQLLCSAHSARSQIAEGVLPHLAGDRFDVMSAGTKPASEIKPFAIKLMHQIAIDISSQSPKVLSHSLDQRFTHNLIIVYSKANDTCPHVWPGLANQDNHLY